VLADKWPEKEHSCRKWKAVEFFDKKNYFDDVDIRNLEWESA
jgi:hypothetical protein